MCEFSSSTKKTQFSGLLLSDFILFCSFILSQPLYFSYFVFFSPYLIKLLSFLSPLFITTSLLLLALFTNLVHENSFIELSESNVSFFFTTFHTLVDCLRSKVDDENEDFQCFVELEAYKIVFETTPFDNKENQVEVFEGEANKEDCLARTRDAEFDRCLSNSSFRTSVSEVLNDDLEEIPFEITDQVMAEAKRLESFWQEKEDVEDSICKRKGAIEVKPPSIEFNKVEEQNEISLRIGSNAVDNTKSEAKVNADKAEEHVPKSKISSQRLKARFTRAAKDGDSFYSNSAENSLPPTQMGSNFGSCGSMRIEKEWRRTLACKLFEERHNVGGGEGMDMLWETYETDSRKMQSKRYSQKNKKSSNESCDDDYDDNEEEIDNGQLCCLQALKFSSGKMHLGIRRPNLVKITKALKGIGWLHHVSKIGKKEYH
ncbi:hypothetical protein CFOL_v3_14229 [Cephalotus follicularis]|uniref:Uncharacterized protein n=1 Tax=Cephalotus follicularis TaxID=3775 RepID=A0A1Q3BRV5_CEPFO|nr:hypothetical protein CFOL_v3_14229 [Cephalotus follicularis]